MVCGLGGDAAANHDFLKALSAHLRAFLRRPLASLPDDVEDLVQETLLAVHKQGHSYQADQPIGAWPPYRARHTFSDMRSMQ